MIDTLDAIKIVTEAPSPKTPVPVESSASAQALVLAAVLSTSAGLALPSEVPTGSKKAVSSSQRPASWNPLRPEPGAAAG